MKWKIKNRKKVKMGDRICLFMPEHPKANIKGYVGEARVLIENKIGRILNYNDIIHHINGNTKDNRYKNLELQSRTKHTRMHNKLRGQIIVKLKCPFCLKIFEKRKGGTQLVKNNKKATFCSRQCSGKFYTYNIKDKNKRLKENVISIYRKF